MVRFFRIYRAALALCAALLLSFLFFFAFFRAIGARGGWSAFCAYLFTDGRAAQSEKAKESPPAVREYPLYAAGIGEGRGFFEKIQIFTCNSGENGL